MDSWLIVGLGNPGPRYAGNRHNIGAMVIDHLAQEAGAKLRAHKARAQAAEIVLGPIGSPTSAKAIIAVPGSYMNESGGPVSGLMTFFKVPADRLIVIHDELDIDFASIRLKRGGGEGGHNGLRSITKSIGTKDYFRVRAGIGRPPGRMEVSDFVLKDFSATERKELDFFIPRIAEATQELMRRGLVDAQNIVHAQ